MTEETETAVTTTGDPAPRGIRWSYTDHWRSTGPAGPIDQRRSRLAMRRFPQRVAAVGFDAIDTFDFRIFS